MRGSGKYLKALADVIYPRRCVVCGRRLLLNEEQLCVYCGSDLPFTYFWKRESNSMADRFNLLIQNGLEEVWDGLDDEGLYGMRTGGGCVGGGCVGGGCVGGEREPYAYAVALFFYRLESGYSNITRELKYRGQLSVGRYFGRMLGERMAAQKRFEDIDVVVPVPLHWMRRWRRGYNQAEVVAAAVAERLGCRMRTDLLIRCRATRTQTLLEVEEKAKNVRGAFRAGAGGAAGVVARTGAEPGMNMAVAGVGGAGSSGSAAVAGAGGAAGGVARTGSEPGMNMAVAGFAGAGSSGSAAVAGAGGLRHILLVDDVFTTGATLYACFAALRSVFPPPVRISVATLGFVGEV